MKKADALKAVIKEIKDQNRSSFGPDDLESFRKKLGRKLTASLAMDFRAEVIKAGIEAPENLSLEDMLPESRTLDEITKAIDSSPPVPGGETVEPNRGQVSRVAKGALIVRRDVETFKQAMSKAVSKEGKVNLFTEIVNEARKINPKVSLDAMQNIKDYLFFTGYLEADKEVSGKLGPSRLSDADVPEYVKPSQKYYKQGLKVLDAGGANEPLVIRKLSAEPDPYVQDTRAKSMPEIAGPETATSEEPRAADLTREQRKQKIRSMLGKAGRGGLKVFVPGVGLAATVAEEAAAAAPTARSSFSEIEYDRMMQKAKREDLIPEESELRGRTMEEVKSRTSFMNQ